jgi:hypothetical protein
MFCLLILGIGTGLLLASACAGPTTREWSVPKEAILLEELKQHELAEQNLLDHRQRLHEIAYPLLRAGVPLCSTDLRYDIGLVIGYGDLGSVEVLSVAAGSPADSAGIEPGDALLGVHGIGVPSGNGAAEGANAALREAAHSGARTLIEVSRAGHEIYLKNGTHISGTITQQHLEESPDGLVRLTSGDETRTYNRVYTIESAEGQARAYRDSEIAETSFGRRIGFAVGRELVCGYSVEVVLDPSLNAFADGRGIYVNSGLMRYLSDDALRVVVAHELAHNAMGHLSTKQSNQAIGAIGGALADIAYEATTGVSTGGVFSGQGANAGAQSFSQEFEIEADYVGLYFMALSGHEVAESANVWRRLALESPDGISLSSTHPSFAARFLIMEEAIAEIEHKMSSGEVLLPEGR